MTPFDKWWNKEGRDLFQRADGWLVAKAAWDAALKNAAPQDKTLSGVCPESAVAAPDEDGHCTVCGLEWPDERDTLEPHICPPGFYAAVIETIRTTKEK